MKLIAMAAAATAFLSSPAVAEDSATTTNRLAGESSPYLLLHAHNPVQWYPWGPEALTRAKAENKPIFLSIGYSSCYWCHVMEREVFSSREIAAYMNEHFVNIKVDREERPDIDDIYMTSLLVYRQLSGSGGGGGWPLSMFLTPTGHPIGGATYLPPEDSPERGRGFPSVARQVVELWENRQADLERSGQMMTAQVQRLIRPSADETVAEPGRDLLQLVTDEIKRQYDPVHGGVDFNGQAPDSARFPNIPRLQFLMDVSAASDDGALLGVVEHSLQSMARGGIRDHLAGGFHRYSTDRRWHVPHFEKMLYDQAMMLGIYARAAQMTGDDFYRTVAGEIADFVEREMTTAQGAFCSALDAETNAIEGEYYVWNDEEIGAVLGDDAALFGRVYGLEAANPFEHGYVLHLPQSKASIAKELNMETEQLEQKLSALRAHLLKVRSRRPRPLLDDKVLTAWNAMMIRALAYSGRVLDRPQDVKAAAKAADFLLENLQDSDGGVLRTWRGGKAKYAAYLDDYAFLVSALLELHEATGEQKWLASARTLNARQIELFYDNDLKAFYFTSTGHEKLIARTSSIYDSVFPSANSLSVQNLLRLQVIDNSQEYATIAKDTLSRFVPALKRSPASCAGLGRAIFGWLQQTDGASQNASLFLARPRWQPVALRTVQPPEEKSEKVVPGRTVSRQDPPAGTTQQGVIQQASFRPVFPAPTTVDEKEKDRPLKVKIYPLYDKLPRKGKCLIAIELQVKFGWHINANPSNPDFLVPTKVELKSKQNVKLTKVKYPKHHELKVQGSPDPYHVYDGKQIVYGLLEIDEKDTTKLSELEFHVSFQGCNSTQCLQPDKVVMKGKLPFAKDGETLKKVNLEKHPKLEKTKPATPAKGETPGRPPGL
ncbi:MAG: thioredoxin domain-containing protein [Planctomycetaceae bacterium]|nr:thioredoxin domain-containing protein [Planctomycetaceae bacterium]